MGVDLIQFANHAKTKNNNKKTTKKANTIYALYSIQYTVYSIYIFIILYDVIILYYTKDSRILISLRGRKMVSPKKAMVF